MNENIKNVIVTGVTGQTGSYMVDFLLKKTDYNICGIVRRTSVSNFDNLNLVINNPRLKIEYADLNDENSIREIVRKEKPDYFINLGASTFVTDSWKNPVLCMVTNSISLIYILESIREYSPECRVFSAGSSEQWGDIIKPLKNVIDTAMSPRSVYGVSKCTANHLCKVYKENYGLYVVHGTFLNHESPRRAPCFLSRKLAMGVARINNCILHNKFFDPIKVGNIYSHRDWNHASDFVDGIWRMLNQEEYRDDLKQLFYLKNIEVCNSKYWSDKIKDYVFSSGKTHSVKEMINLAFKHAGIIGKWRGSGLNEKFLRLKTNEILVEIDENFYRPSDLKKIVGDSSETRDELKWIPKYDFDSLIKEMVSCEMNIYDK